MRLRTRHPLDQAQTQTRRNTSRTRLLFGRRDQQEHDACHHRKKEHQGNCRAFHRLTLCGLGAIRDPLAANQTAGGTTQPESPSLPFGSTSEPSGICILPCCREWMSTRRAPFLWGNVSGTTPEPNLALRVGGLPWKSLYPGHTIHPRNVALHHTAILPCCPQRLSTAFGAFRTTRAVSGFLLRSALRSRSFCAATMSLSRTNGLTILSLQRR